MAVRETLQLRHQLLSPGICAYAAAYDTRRHHVLVFDSRYVALRLLSLRRELKSTPLFDTAPVDISGNPATKQGDPYVKRFVQKLNYKVQGGAAAAMTPPPLPTKIVASLTLSYAPEVDVFVCVHAAHDARKGSPTTFAVLFVEPVTLNKLVTYDGPTTQSLSCSFFSASTSRLVLAAECPIGHGGSSLGDANIVEVSSHVIDLLQISKRSMQVQARPTGGGMEDPNSPQSPEVGRQAIILCVEKLKLRIRHHSTLAVVCGSNDLETLYGIVGASKSTAGDQKDDAEAHRTIVIWRLEHQDPPRYIMLRRVMIQQRVTALALSPCERWLLIGGEHGFLQVWRVSDNLISVVKHHAMGTAANDRSASLTQCGDIASIEVAEQDAGTLSGPTSNQREAIVITSDSTTGIVRHWRFSVSTRQCTDKVDDTVPTLEFVGSYVPDKPAVGASGAANRSPERHKVLKDRAPSTITICVGIDTGRSVETVLLVVRGDVIHVLKVQVALYQVCLFPDNENAVLVRAGTRSSVLCVTQGASSTVRLLTQDDSLRNSYTERVLSLDSPGGTSYITNMETTTVPGWSQALVVCGWSCGVLEIYALPTHERVAVLQDRHHDVKITALAVCVDSKRNKHQSSRQEQQPGSRHTHDSVIIVAGAEDGSLFGWSARYHAETAQPNRANAISSQLKVSSTVQSARAHSTHVVQLCRVCQENGSPLVCSIGADGSVKMWQASTLTMLAYLNAASRVQAAIPTCVEAICQEFPRFSCFLVVGCDDGALAVWNVQQKLTFAECSVGSRHDRQVTSVASVDLPIVGTHPLSTEAKASSILFLTASLDMTVVLWEVVDGVKVEERRYFDIGAPVVSLCLLDGNMFVALPHELCTLRLFASSEQDDRSIQDQITNVSDCYSAPSLSSTISISASDHINNKLTSNGDVATNCPPDARTSSATESSHRRDPESLDYLSINIPIVKAAGSAAESAMISDRDGVMTPKQLTGWPLEGDQLQHDLSASESLRQQVRAFFIQNASKGTLEAEKLAVFLTQSSRITSARRARELVARRLHDIHLDAKSRLDLDTTRDILAELLSPGDKNTGQKPARGTSGASTSIKADRMKRKEPKGVRKALITYNAMGEKSVRWVQVERSPSDASIAQSEDKANQRLLSPDSVRLSSPSSQDDLSLSVSTPAAESEMQPIEFGSNPPTTATRRKLRSRKQSVVESRALSRGKTPFIHDPLVQHLKLSQGFQPYWSRGYCWCRPVVHLLVVQGEASKMRCSNCGKRQHAVEIAGSDYRPHFSLGVILEIIVEVYMKLSASAHAHLFKKSASGSEPVGPSSASSVFGELFAVMKNRYGMQDVVELKLKLLLVSLCRWIRVVDAIAVFGEFLAMHASDDARVDELVPQELVDLCVCCYAWLYAREMIQPGDAINISVHNQSHDPKLACSEHCGHDHWQFVPLSCVLLCAQDNLLYPIVSPGFLRNILLFTDDYAQSTRHEPEVPRIDVQRSRDRQGRWIELHRFLRLVVGEWRQQNAAFRTAERFLFELPERPLTAGGSEIIEKLRLLLSCLVFFDHDRIGVMVTGDFERLLRRLRYLWPNENMTEEEAIASSDVSITFENAIRAVCKRFADTSRDGQLCYLDFWAMLYVVGMKTCSMIKFREIPSFCRDYKLEVAPKLSELLLDFMERSCTVLLPQGLHLGKSSFDQRATSQHVRRVGGLHDGTFDLGKSLKVSMSATEMISGNASGPRGLFIESMGPVLHQSASTSAVDRFRPIAQQEHHQAATAVKRTSHGGKKKEPALIRVSSIGLGGTETVSFDMPRPAATDSSENEKRQPISAVVDKSPAGSNLYIQFHDVEPRRRPVRGGIPKKLETQVEVESQASDPLIDCGDADSQVGEHIELETQADTLIQTRHAGDSPSCRYDEEDIDQDDGEAAEMLIPDDDSGMSERIRLGTSKFVTPEALLSRDLRLTRRQSNTTVVRVPSVCENEALPFQGAHELLSVSANGQREHSPQHSARSRGNSITSNTMLPISQLIVDGLTGQLESTEIPTAEETDASVSEPEQPPLYVTEPELPQSEQQEDEPQVLVADIVESENMPEDNENEPNNHNTDDESNGQSDETADDHENVDADGDDEEEEESNGSEVSFEEEELSARNEEDARTPSPDEIAKDEEPILIQDSLAEPCELDHDDAHESEIESPEQSNAAPSNSDAFTIVPDHHLAAVDSVSTDPVKCEPPKTLTEHQTEDQSSVVASQDPDNQSEPLPAELATAIDDDTPSIGSMAHTFRFSQQPNFRSGAQAFNNPFRYVQWSPRNDSDSDSDDNSQQTKPKTKEIPSVNLDSDAFDDDNGDCVEDMELRLSETSRRRMGRPLKLKRNGGSTRLASSRISPSHESAREGGHDLGSEGGSEDDRETESALPTNDTKRRFNRDLYASDDLGAGIVFSSDAEQNMQHKWSTLFQEAELAMFSPLKQAMDKKLADQRYYEEMQSQLRRKRQEEEEQAMRQLQRSKAAATGDGALTGRPKSSAGSEPVQSPNFREQRVQRESCNQLNLELEYGESVNGDCCELASARYFHFRHRSSNGATGAIITVVLKILSGDADMFLSSETKVPTATDYMWRSIPSKSTEPPVLTQGSVGKTLRIVLYPHDLLKARAVSRSQPLTIDGEHAADGETLSFFISVVALAPNTEFSIAVMSSGQKTEQSRAMQAVDFFIDRFNAFAESVSGSSSSRASEMHLSSRPGSRIKAETRQDFVKRIKAVSNIHVQEQIDDARDNELSDAEGDDFLTSRSIDSNADADTDVESFQHLLEKLSRNTNRPTNTSRKRSSFLLAGPDDEQREFVQDEVSRLLHQVSEADEGFDSRGLSETAIDEHCLRPLQQTAGRKKLPFRMKAKLQARLSPLENQAQLGGSKSLGALHDASARVAKFAPRPIAYSLSKLEPPLDLKQSSKMRRPK